MWNTCNRPRHMGQSHDPLTRHCEKMWIPTCHGFRFSKDLGLFPWIAFYINDTVIGTLSIEPAPHPLIAFLKIEFYNKFAPKWRALLETFLSQIWSKVHVMLVTADDTWQVSSGECLDVTDLLHIQGRSPVTDPLDMRSRLKPVFWESIHSALKQLSEKMLGFFLKFWSFPTRCLWFS